MTYRFTFLTCLIAIGSLTSNSHSLLQAQQPQVVDQLQESGTVRDIRPGVISILNKDNQAVTCLIQNKGERAVSIAGFAFNVPAEISVSAELPINLIEKGMIVQFTAPTNKSGKIEGELDQLQVLAGSDAKLKIEFTAPAENKKKGSLSVVGRVLNINRNRLQIQVPKSKWSKREKLNLKLKKEGTFLLNDDNLNRVRAGDEVTHMQAMRMSTGEIVVKRIAIRLTADRQQMTTSFEDQLEQKFSDLSNDPGEPRELRSDNYILYTDLSQRSAQILLAKLETMHSLIGGYYGTRPRIPIECYVVVDLKKWKDHDIPPAGIAKIREPAGVTMTRRSSLGGQAKSTVYSCDNHKVVQHEAVHAFCGQAFGSSGPVWYAEGMAEMGQYWKPGELAVNIDPFVINYLTNAKPKKMAAIVAAGQITGDSWQAYAWRWALCHLLANNPNYARRFKQLGLNMMTGGDDSFENAFGEVADNISFEYDQFVKNFGNGYRVDLCAWDWSVKPSNLSGNRHMKLKVAAQAGWQPTKLLAKRGAAYDFVCEGTWKLSSTDPPIDADGDDQGRGRLIGVILHDFQLSEPFELGKKGSFTAPYAGQLYLRCQDGWTELADNQGEITANFRRSSEKK